MLKLVIALCYLSLGTYLFVNSNLLAPLDKTFRALLAALFIAYGAFRLYRVVNDLRNE